MTSLNGSWFAALLLAGMLAGCTSPGGEPGAGPDPGPAHTGNETADENISLPIDSYGYTVVESGQIILARELLTADCLRQRGVSDVRAPDRTAIGRSARSRQRDLGLHGNKRRYGVTDFETVTTYGYHLPSTVDQTEITPDIDDKTTYAHPEPYRACTDQASQAIAGTAPLGNADLVRKIAWDSYEYSLRSTELAETLKKWSSCMESKGYSYPNPLDAAAMFDINAATVTSREIATATADVTCKQEVRLVEVWQDREKRYQNTEIARNRQELDSARAAHDQCMERVANVIANHT